MKNKNGITLIALVITIIVILILAGVTLSMLLGQNSVVNKAKESKISHDYAALKENIDMVISERNIKKSSNQEIQTTFKIEYIIHRKV